MSPSWSRDPRALWRRCGQRVVVLVPESDETLLLSGTGQLTWELLAEPIDDADLTLTLAELYEADAETVGRELRPFLQQLTAAGAVAQT